MITKAELRYFSLIVTGLAGIWVMSAIVKREYIPNIYRVKTNLHLLNNTFHSKSITNYYNSLTDNETSMNRPPHIIQNTSIYNGTKTNYYFVNISNLKHLHTSYSTQLPNQLPWNHLNKTRPNLQIVTFGRLGNQMFHYAVCYCIALQTNRTPTICQQSELLALFSNLSAKQVPHYLHPDQHNQTNMIGEPGWSIHDSKITEKVMRNNETWLHGCFQSWKYFSSCENDIRREFTFSHDIQSEVVDVMKEFCEEYSKLSKITYSDITFIGVHMRLGDMLEPESIKLGHTKAPAAYINKAMNYYNKKYPRALFIVTSEDIPWCKENIKSSLNNIYFSPYTEIKFRQDFAMLSLCNHSIITVGSFGWFSAWLAKGEVVYYKNYPISSSPIANGFSYTDRYPPSWTAMG